MHIDEILEELILETTPRGKRLLKLLLDDIVLNLEDVKYTLDVLLTTNNTKHE